MPSSFTSPPPSPPEGSSPPRESEGGLPCGEVPRSSGMLRRVCVLTMGGDFGDGIWVGARGFLERSGVACSTCLALCGVWRCLVLRCCCPDWRLTIGKSFGRKMETGMSSSNSDFSSASFAAGGASALLAQLLPPADAAAAEDRGLQEETLSSKPTEFCAARSVACTLSLASATAAAPADLGSERQTTELCITQSVARTLLFASTTAAAVADRDLQGRTYMFCASAATAAAADRVLEARINWGCAARGGAHTVSLCGTSKIFRSTAASVPSKQKPISRSIIT